MTFVPCPVPGRYVEGLDLVDPVCFEAWVEEDSPMAKAGKDGEVRRLCAAVARETEEEGLRYVYRRVEEELEVAYAYSVKEDYTVVVYVSAVEDDYQEIPGGRKAVVIAGERAEYDEKTATLTVKGMVRIVWGVSVPGQGVYGVNFARIVREGEPESSGLLVYEADEVRVRPDGVEMTKDGESRFLVE